MESLKKAREVIKQTLRPADPESLTCKKLQRCI
jgi:hypothetical protein